LNLGAAMAKRAVIRSTGLRARPLSGPASKADIVADVRTHLWPLIEEGLVKPVVHAEIPIAHAAAAHQLLDSPDTVGKVVLRVR
jgi:NADPH:quinone reductase-like Zn-dependent oxidoreductase